MQRNSHCIDTFYQIDFKQCLVSKNPTGTQMGTFQLQPMYNLLSYTRANLHSAPDGSNRLRTMMISTDLEKYERFVHGNG